MWGQLLCFVNSLAVPLSWNKLLLILQLIGFLIQLQCFKFFQYAYMHVSTFFFWVYFWLIQVAKSSNMPPSIRDALYQNLPPNIKSALRSKIQSFHVKDEVFSPFSYPFSLSIILLYYVDWIKLGQVEKFGISNKLSCNPFSLHPNNKNIFNWISWFLNFPNYFVCHCCNLLVWHPANRHRNQSWDGENTAVACSNGYKHSQVRTQAFLWTAIFQFITSFPRIRTFLLLVSMV